MTKAIAKLQTSMTTRRSEEGATAVEYGLMVALIAIVIIAAVILLGGKLSSLFNQVAGSI
jgi:pilus assembly protein Flp/PilA